MSTMEDNARIIADEALRRFEESGRQRVLIAVAGAPGSGKSTLAERAVEIVNGRGVHAALFPMDGYHYDDVVLEQMGRREFKGAIDTFDAHGLRHMLERLKRNEDDVVAIPVFDRAIEIARAGGRLVKQSTDLIICEGNYLLAGQAPWHLLNAIFDLTVFVDVEEGELRRRLRERWRGYGLGEDEITKKVENNDLPNGRGIILGSSDPDIRLTN